MFRTIIVGCDGSEHEADAIALAQQLRDPDGGRLVLTNVFPLYRGIWTPIEPFEYAEWLADQATESLHRAEANVAVGVPCERQAIAAPSAAAGLDDLADTLGADLIVLGGSHRGAVGELAGRKTVQRLLHGAPCAVAVAAPGQGQRFGDHPRICVAYDASPEARFALDTAYGIAATTSASVDVCTALEPIVYAAGFAGGVYVGLDEEREKAGRADLDEVVALAPDGIAAEGHILSGPPASVVLAQAGDDVDLVVAGSRGYGALHRAIAGSVSGRLLTDGKAPILVTPRVVARAASAELAGAGASA